MTSFPALALLLQLCCAAKLITLVDDGSPRGRANDLLYHKTWALCCAPSFFMALTVFGALHVLLSETFTGAKTTLILRKKLLRGFTFKIGCVLG